MRSARTYLPKPSGIIFASAIGGSLRSKGSNLVRLRRIRFGAGRREDSKARIWFGCAESDSVQGGGGSDSIERGEERLDDPFLVGRVEAGVERQRHRARAAVLAHREHPLAEAVACAHVRLQVD